MIRRLVVFAAVMVGFVFGFAPGKKEGPALAQGVLQAVQPAPGLAQAIAAEATVREITVVNLEFEGTKIWVPATLVVRKGEKVRLRLINKVKSDPPQHGFAIPDLNVRAVVNRDKPETVEFMADKAGLFQTQCQLHPAHVGGQLLVLE